MKAAKLLCHAVVFVTSIGLAYLAGYWHSQAIYTQGLRDGLRIRFPYRVEFREHVEKVPSFEPSLPATEQDEEVPC